MVRGRSAIDGGLGWEMMGGVLELGGVCGMGVRGLGIMGRDVCCFWGLGHEAAGWV